LGIPHNNRRYCKTTVTISYLASSCNNKSLTFVIKSEPDKLIIFSHKLPRFITSILALLAPKTLENFGKD